MNGITALSRLSLLVLENPERFLQPTGEIQQAAILAAKAVFDPLASDVADTQAKRRSEDRRKRKRSDVEQEDAILQLRQIYTDGFAVKQIWEQARRILDAAQRETQRDLLQHTGNGSYQTDKQTDKDNVSAGSVDRRLLGKDAYQSNDVDSDEHIDSDMDEGLVSEDGGDEEQEIDNAEEAEEDIEVDSDLAMSSDNEVQSRKSIYVPDPNGLNDGFFSIDDFNKQSQFLEQMDARGDDDNPSDEDEIDWDADPLATSSTIQNLRGPRKNQDDSEDGSDEEDGPVFADEDSNVAEDDSDDGAELDHDQNLDGAMGNLSNANDIRYADFFEPPPQKPSKKKRMRALPKTQPPKSEDATTGRLNTSEEQLKNDVERAMADVRRDLLDSDEEEVFDDESDLSDKGTTPRGLKPSDKNMSTHEKQRAVIAAEIRRLEAANVAKRDWQLSGEARAADRPVNSLIEEDLEFERTGKPIAPVTAETTEEIDALIKRRILARDFDEVIRRVPGSLNLAGETRRGRVELDDSKPQASLGEMYEAEHQKNADPLSYVDKRSVALKKQHGEIDVLWKQVREQLDLLSNMHFKPKRVEVEIKTVADKPRIAMEDARPVGEIESGEGGMLAPQEVYRPGIDARSGQEEIMLSGGAAVSREEMSREEKVRRRRREKERTKKGQGNSELHVLGKGRPNQSRKRKEKESDKSNIIEDLKRGGVKVIGKEGELQAIGRQKKGQKSTGEMIGSNLKL